MTGLARMEPGRSRIELFDMVYYLAARGQVPNDAAGELLLAAVGNFASGHRLSRRGVRQVVDAYLRAAKVKRPRVSNHALRPTGATLAYRYTHDLRAVQDMLGHQDPKNHRPLRAGCRSSEDEPGPQGACRPVR